MRLKCNLALPLSGSPVAWWATKTTKQTVVCGHCLTACCQFNDKEEELRAFDLQEIFLYRFINFWNFDHIKQTCDIISVCSCQEVPKAWCTSLLWFLLLRRTIPPGRNVLEKLCSDVKLLIFMNISMTICRTKRFYHKIFIMCKFNNFSLIV